MFNFSKRNNKMQKIAESASYPQMLSEQNAERGYTLDDSTPNINGLLDTLRGGSEDSKTVEGSLNSSRGNMPSDITEKQLDKRESYVVHRTDKNDSVKIKPMDALAEAYDQKYRKAFADAEEGGDTSFWDKFVGEQLLGEKTKVHRNVPSSGSQLQNHPDRFTSLKGQPSSPIATDNFSSFTKEDKVKPMVMAQAEERLKSADAMLFHIYYMASKQDRSLTAKEHKAIESISAVKRAILAQAIDPTVPGNPFEEPNKLSPLSEDLEPSTGADMGIADISTGPVVDNPASIDTQTNDVDFLDGNPTVEAPTPEGLPPDENQLPPDMPDRYQQYVDSITKEIAPNDTPF
jgi:hypothetical protein